MIDVDLPPAPPIDVVRSFLRTFYGYGNLGAPLWFVGMEEGCEARDQAGILAESVRRITAWRARQASTVDDLRGYHREIGILRHLSDGAPLQATWRGLMRIRAEALGEDASPSSLRAHQIGRWGDQDGDCCLLELFPLAKPKRASWPFEPWSQDLQELESDASYIEELAAIRVGTLKQLVAEYRPVAVVCYGSEHMAHWDAIADSPFKPLPGTKRPVGKAERDGIWFYRMWHPQYLSNSDLKVVGADIRSHPRWKP